MFRISILLCTMIMYQTVLAQTKDLSLHYEFLCDFTVTIGKPIDIGETLYGKRIIFPAKSGHFEGPNFKGKVLANGGDWTLKLNDKTSKLDIRAVLETDDGAYLYTSYGGYMHLHSDGHYTLRSNPTFETSSEKYGWLNHTIAVGIGELIEGGVHYKIYTIK